MLQTKTSLNYHEVKLCRQFNTIYHIPLPTHLSNKIFGKQKDFEGKKAGY